MYNTMLHLKVTLRSVALTLHWVFCCEFGGLPSPFQLTNLLGWSKRAACSNQCHNLQLHQSEFFDKHYEMSSTYICYPFAISSVIRFTKTPRRFLATSHELSWWWPTVNHYLHLSYQDFQNKLSVWRPRQRYAQQRDPINFHFSRDLWCISKVWKVNLSAIQ